MATVLGQRTGTPCTQENGTPQNRAVPRALVARVDNVHYCPYVTVNETGGHPNVGSQRQPSNLRQKPRLAKSVGLLGVGISRPGYVRSVLCRKHLDSSR